VRIDQGEPLSPHPLQQNDYVIIRSEGKGLGPDSQPIPGPINENPQAHIPLSDWLKWPGWNTAT
jgi:hypothetical protein